MLSAGTILCQAQTGTRSVPVIKPNGRERVKYT